MCMKLCMPRVCFREKTECVKAMFDVTVPKNVFVTGFFLLIGSVNLFNLLFFCQSFNK